VKRSGPLRRVTPLRARKRTGLPQSVRARVLDRDLFGCAYCGNGPSARAVSGLRLEVHHRLPLGRGGNDDIRNLVTTCGLGNAAGCHRLMDLERPEAVRRGFVIPTGGDPATTPLLLWDGRLVLLDGHGQYVRAEAA
jgi:hypothetical protein